MATAELTVISLGRTEVSASAYVAEIQRRLAAQDRVAYEMHAMGTNLDGTAEDIFALVAELRTSAIGAPCCGLSNCAWGMQTSESPALRESRKSRQGASL